MEPKRQTTSRLLEVQQELINREMIFHRPEHGTTRHDFEEMTAEELWETGASGQRYSRQYAIDNLVERYSVPHEDEWETDNFYCQKIAPENCLLTYTMSRPARDPAHDPVATVPVRLANLLSSGNGC